jgi:D-arabinose 1-dehydrogenase-like Zn-dependent alcohol dehydrogenase
MSLAQTVPANTTAVVPDELKSKEAAPLMCAGVTVYNSLRHLDAMPGTAAVSTLYYPLLIAVSVCIPVLRLFVPLTMSGDLVAVQGLGGLGHLAVQYAHKVHEP